MSYEDIPIAHVLNFYLYDAFKASGEGNLRDWLGVAGKSFHEIAPDNYTQDRHQEVLQYAAGLGLDDLEAWLNDSNTNPALSLTLRSGDELVVRPTGRDGLAYIETPYFERDYAREIQS